MFPSNMRRPTEHVDFLLLGEARLLNNPHSFKPRPLEQMWKSYYPIWLREKTVSVDSLGHVSHHTLFDSIIAKAFDGGFFEIKYSNCIITDGRHNAIFIRQKNCLITSLCYGTRVTGGYTSHELDVCFPHRTIGIGQSISCRYTP